jgi:8-oxo-dGTP pyrophosphatase MutT (NUDIX family)
MAKVRAAGLFLVNKENKILVGHPTNHDPNFWSIPKGKIDGNETPLEAAIRETYEESNFKLFKDLHKFIEIGKYVYRHKKKDIMLFAHFEKESGYWDNIVIQCNSNVPVERGGFPEMDDYKWVTLDEARDMLHKTQVDALDVLDEKIDEHNNEVNGKYDMLWCNECLDFVYHREKLSAVLNGKRVCNRCSSMNPVCVLIKETDATESHFMKVANEFHFMGYNEDGSLDKSYTEPKVGRSLLMGAIRLSFQWLTTPITEIIEIKDEKPRKVIKFKTKNSIYELYYHIL